MKRAGNVFEAVVDPMTLRLAFWKASRGKRHRPDQRACAVRLEEEIEGLRVGLLQGTTRWGRGCYYRAMAPGERKAERGRGVERIEGIGLFDSLERKGNP